METLPYRFEFETDEQYEARTGVDLNQGQGTETPSPASIVATPPADTTSRGGSFLILPWWMITILALILLIGFYESYRRRLTKVLREQHQALEAQSQASSQPEDIPIPPPPVPSQEPPSPTPPEPPVFLRQRLEEKAWRATLPPVTTPPKPTSLITRRHTAKSHIRRRTAIKRLRKPPATDSSTVFPSL